MFIIACLGNPGKRYRKNRHNIGFIIGEYLTKEYIFSINRKSFSSYSGSGQIDGNDILLMMPHTYMNSSGVAVQKALDYYRLKPDQLIVIHDEIELAFGECGRKFGGGHKGHNGIRSIIQEIGAPDFHRIRFGVGRPENLHVSVADYVLANFTDEEFVRIKESFPIINDIIISIIESD